MTNQQVLKDIERRKTERAALAEEIAERQVRLAGMDAEIGALAKRVRPVGSESTLPVKELVARFVEAQPEAVAKDDVAEHLRGLWVQFNEASLSMQLSRLVKDGRLDRAAGGGKYRSAQTRTGPNTPALDRSAHALIGSSVASLPCP